MRTLFKVGISLLLLAFVLIGLSYGVLRTQGVSSPSNPAGRVLGSELRPLGKDIINVELSGPIDLTVRQGATPLLKVRGEQRLLANVDTRLEGNTVHIGTKGMLLHHRSPLQVELVLPALQQLEVNGSGDSTVNGFSAERFTLQLDGSGNVTLNGSFRQIIGAVHGSGNLNLNGGDSDSVLLQISGSGQITASGSSKSLKAALTGSGDLDAEHLASDQVSVNLSGSGTAHVFAKEVAKLILRGSGDIDVSGNPSQRTVNRSGSGDVNWNQ